MCKSLQIIYFKRMYTSIMFMSNFRTALLILLQQTDLNPRTSKKNFTNPKLSRASNLLSNCIASLKHDEIYQVYQENNRETSNLLKEAVGNHNTCKVLDIGCGIAGYHSEWMKNSKGDLFLFDNSTFNLSSLRYGMGETERYYNSLSLAKRYLMRQGVDSNRIHTIEIDSEKFTSRKYDLIVSFISLGFHYHVNTYWLEIMSSLSEKGQVILDIRNNSSSDDFIQDKKEKNVILVLSAINYGKFTRYTFQKA